MIIRSAEPRAPAGLHWLIQLALLLILIAAMLLVGAALATPRAKNGQSRAPRAADSTLGMVSMARWERI